MLSAIVAQSFCRATTVTSSIPRVFVARGFALGEKMKGKEAVEEARFIREREMEFFENKKRRAAEDLKEHEATVFQETVAPAMAEAEAELKSCGDTVSEGGLEALARWKLNGK